MASTLFACSGAPDGFSLTITGITPTVFCSDQRIALDVEALLDNSAGDSDAIVRGRRAVFDFLGTRLRVSLDGEVTVAAGEVVMGTFSGERDVPVDPCDACTDPFGTPNFVAPEIRLSVNGEAIDQLAGPTVVSCP